MFHTPRAYQSTSFQWRPVSVSIFVPGTHSPAPSNSAPLTHLSFPIRVSVSVSVSVSTSSTHLPSPVRAYVSVSVSLCLTSFITICQKQFAGTPSRFGPLSCETAQSSPSASCPARPSRSHHPLAPRSPSPSPAGLKLSLLWEQPEANPIWHYPRWPAQISRVMRRTTKVGRGNWARVFSLG